MPVRMVQYHSGKNKGKWKVIEPDGTVVYGPTTRAKAREVTQGRNLGEMTPAERRRRGIPARRTR